MGESSLLPLFGMPVFIQGLKKIFIKCMCSVVLLCLTLCEPVDCTLPGSSAHVIFSGKNSGVGCHFLLQGIFLTQESNPGLLHCR